VPFGWRSSPSTLSCFDNLPVGFAATFDATDLDADATLPMLGFAVGGRLAGRAIRFVDFVRDFLVAIWPSLMSNDSIKCRH
jgi:hypothetical protein